MVDSNLPRMVQKEFETLAPVVAEGLGTMLGAKVSIDLSGGTLLDEAQFFARFEGRGIACRSQFVHSSSGIGGIHLEERAAQVVAAKALFMDVPAEGSAFEFEEHREALEEIFNVFIGAWNRSASTDFRMSTKVDERAVEHYSDLTTFPRLSGVLPTVLVGEVSIDGETSSIGIYLPRKHCSHLNREPFDPPDRFHLASFEGGPDGGGTAIATATAKATQTQTRIVIIDDTQILSQIIREYTAEGKWEMVRDQKPTSGHSAILVMGDPKELTDQLCPSHLVHLREKSSE